MADLNQCNFIGRFVEAPKLIHAGETAICNFTIACGYKSKDQDITEYVRCVAYKRSAEIIAEYMNKGDQIQVTGRMATRKWTDKEGATKYSTEIILNSFQMLQKSSKNGQKVTPIATQKDDDSDLPF